MGYIYVESGDDSIFANGVAYICSQGTVLGIIKQYGGV